MMGVFVRGGIPGTNVTILMSMVPLAAVSLLPVSLSSFLFFIFFSSHLNTNHITRFISFHSQHKIHKIYNTKSSQFTAPFTIHIIKEYELTFANQQGRTGKNKNI
jgi:hypothetical protein